MTPGRTEGRVLVGIVVIALVWSGVAPVSRLLCWLLVLHAFVLLYGRAQHLRRNTTRRLVP